MYTAKSLKAKKSYCIFIQQRKLQKKIISACIFGFNNQFIKATRTEPIFQKFQKNSFVFLILGIMNLYVKRTPNIKKIVFFYRH